MQSPCQSLSIHAQYDRNLYILLYNNDLLDILPTDKGHSGTEFYLHLCMIMAMMHILLY